MALIEVSPQKIEKIFRSAEEYCQEHRGSMRKIDGDINASHSKWKGRDYDEMSKKWQSMNEKQSTSEKMLTAMENYAVFLRTTQIKYENFAAAAINRAHGIPSWGI